MRATWRRLLQLVIVFVMLISSVVHARSLPVLHRVKKQTADQRIAELQALIALSQQLSDMDQYSPSVYGHGLVDPHNSGRRRRSVYEGSPEDILDGHMATRNSRRPRDGGVWAIDRPSAR